MFLAGVTSISLAVTGLERSGSGESDFIISAGNMGDLTFLCLADFCFAELGGVTKACLLPTGPDGFFFLQLFHYIFISYIDVLVQE